MSKYYINRKLMTKMKTKRVLKKWKATWLLLLVWVSH